MIILDMLIVNQMTPHDVTSSLHRTITRFSSLRAVLVTCLEHLKSHPPTHQAFHLFRISASNKYGSKQAPELSCIVKLDAMCQNWVSKRLM